MNRNPTANHTKSFFHRTKRTFKKYFIAHEANDHHPHIFRMRAVLTFLFSILAIEGGLFLYTNRPIELDSQKAAVIANTLIAYTNDARSAESLAPLTRNSQLDLAAQKKVQDMIATGYFAHFSPDGTSPWHWISESGYRYETAGENLAIDFYDSKDVVNAWMNSPGHRKNIMKQKYTEIGMAVADGQFENRRTTFVVQFFATPTVAAPAPVVVSTPAPAASINPKPTNSTPAAANNPAPVVTAMPASLIVASATSTATGTAPSVAAVAGVSTEGAQAESLFARVTNDMFGFTASPRNSVEVALFILIACVTIATLLYMHGSKIPVIHRKVAFVSISLLIILILLIMVNRTFLRMSEDDIGPAAEISLETASSTNQ